MLNGTPIQVPSAVILLILAALIVGSLVLMRSAGSLGRTAAPPRRPRWLARSAAARAS